MIRVGLISSQKKHPSSKCFPIIPKVKNQGANPIKVLKKPNFFVNFLTVHYFNLIYTISDFIIWKNELKKEIATYLFSFYRIDSRKYAFSCEFLLSCQMSVAVSDFTLQRDKRKHFFPNLKMDLD